MVPIIFTGECTGYQINYYNMEAVHVFMVTTVKDAVG